MNGFEKMKAHKKNGIVRAVKDLVSSNGIQSLSIKAIAETARVSQVTIYNHFKSKNELIMNITRDIIADIYDAYVEILNSNRCFMEKLELILEIRIRAVMDGSWHFIISAAQFDYEIDHIVKTGLLLNIKRSLYDLIEQGKAEGVVNAAIETNTLLLYLEAFRNWFDTNLDKAVNEKRAKDLMELFVYGIRGNKNTN